MSAFTFSHAPLRTADLYPIDNVAIVLNIAVDVTDSALIDVTMILRPRTSSS